MAAPLLADLDTPALIVDQRVLNKNIARMQRIAAEGGVSLRPHIKTHKSIDIARTQLAAGARGVTVATLTEAEVMAEAGVRDLFVAYPPVGGPRLRRLARLTARARVVVGVDNSAAVGILSRLSTRSSREIGYRWEIDSGLKRLGTVPGAETADQIIGALDSPGTVFDGLFTHAGHAYKSKSTEEIRRIGRSEGEALVSTAEVLIDRGVPVRVLSAGSTPTAKHASTIQGVTEIRPGNYVFNDATQVALGVATPSDCAQTILATVVSRPAPDRLVVDAGSKALPSENPSGRAIGWGIVVGNEDLRVERLYEEHAVLTASSGRSNLRPGDRVRIIPNHACTASNLHSHFWFVDGEEVLRAVPVAARGWTETRS